MPYPSEHAARVISPDKFEKDSFRRTNIAKGIDIIIGHLKGETTMTTQAYRFNKEQFTEQEAKDWLKKHDIKYILFEPAKKEDRITNQNGIVDIYLYGTIGTSGDNKIDGDFIASQIRALDESGVKLIREHINSDGGEITNGLSIVTANLSCQNAKVYTYNEGVAASMAGIIHQTGSKRYATSYSQFMMHEPSMGGQTIENTEDPIIKKRLQAAKDQLISILQNSTGMNVDELNKMMKEETWLNADQCEKMGFVTKGCVINSSLKISNTANPKEILKIVNQAFNNLNINNMSKTTCAKCGEKLDWEEGKDEMTCPGCKAKLNNKGEVIEPKKNATNSVNEPITDKAIETLTGQVASLTNIVNGLKAENDALKAERNAAKKDQSSLMLNKAIEEGKILDTAKDELLTEYGEKPEVLKKIIDAIPMPHNSIMGNVNRANEDAPIPGGFKTLRELERGNPALAEKFAMENPVAYNKLYNAEYGIK